MASIRILALVAASLAFANAQQNCLTAPPIGYVGRDGGPGGGGWCTSQITTCSQLCGGNASVNTCNGPDDSTHGGLYCYDCACADGSVPQLNLSGESIPGLICGREEQNCNFSYSQVGEIGNCSECPYMTVAYTPPAFTSSATSTVVPPVPTTTSTTIAVVTTTSSTSIVVPPTTSSSPSTSSTPSSTTTPTPTPTPTTTAQSSTTPSTSAAPTSSSASQSAPAPASTSLFPGEGSKQRIGLAGGALMGLSGLVAVLL